MGRGNQSGNKGDAQQISRAESVSIDPVLAALSSVELASLLTKTAENSYAYDIGVAGGELHPVDSLVQIIGDVFSNDEFSQITIWEQGAAIRKFLDDENGPLKYKVSVVGTADTMFTNAHDAARDAIGSNYSQSPGTGALSRVEFGKIKNSYSDRRDAQLVGRLNDHLYGRGKKLDRHHQRAIDELLKERADKILNEKGHSAYQDTHGIRQSALVELSKIDTRGPAEKIEFIKHLESATTEWVYSMFFSASDADFAMSALRAIGPRVFCAVVSSAIVELMDDPEVSDAIEGFGVGREYYSKEIKVHLEKWLTDEQRRDAAIKIADIMRNWAGPDATHFRSMTRQYVPETISDWSAGADPIDYVRLWWD